MEINIRGTNIHYELYPKRNKPTMILIHGFLSSTFSFRRLIPLLRNDFNILALDFPPFGKSGKAKSFTYSFENIAKTIIELLHQLKLEKVTLVGHSMGGQICLHIAKQSPCLVRNAVLLSCSGYLNRSNRHLTLATYIPFFNIYVKNWLRRQGLKRTLQNVVCNHELIDDEMMNGYLQPFLDNKIFNALTKMIRDREGDLLPEDLHQINTPCLLIWGEEDKVVPIQTGKRLHEDLPNSAFVSIPNAGHLIPEEKPEVIYDIIIRNNSI